MSILRVDKITFNDSENAYISIANTWNVSMYVSNTEVVTYYSNNAVIYPTSTLIVGSTNVVASVVNTPAIIPAFNQANTANTTAIEAFKKANTSLQNNATTLISTGYTVASFNVGTLSTGTTTLSGANGNYQFYTNNGAHTIAAPSTDTAIDILVTNDASAGAITFTGFTVQSDGTGDTYATTNTNRYLLSVRRINGISTYIWKSLQ